MGVWYQYLGENGGEGGWALNPNPSMASGAWPLPQGVVGWGAAYGHPLDTTRHKPRRGAVTPDPETQLRAKRAKLMLECQDNRRTP